MGLVTCEAAAMARMAISDGEMPVMGLEELTAHLAGCEECRQEPELSDALADLFKLQKRRDVSSDLWPAISERLAVTSARPTATRWPIFLAIGLLLFIFKLVEMIPEHELGVLFKLAPLFVIVILFACVKENPFKISLELTLEGDR
jgi:predicted anti-sigma-YlaC factor YlaD